MKTLTSSLCLLYFLLCIVYIFLHWRLGAFISSLNLGSSPRLSMVKPSSVGWQILKVIKLSTSFLEMPNLTSSGQPAKSLRTVSSFAYLISVRKRPSRFGRWTDGGQLRRILPFSVKTSSDSQLKRLRGQLKWLANKERY